MHNFVYIYVEVHLPNSCPILESLKVFSEDIVVILVSIWQNTYWHDQLNDTMNSFRNVMNEKSMNSSGPMTLPQGTPDFIPFRVDKFPLYNHSLSSAYQKIIKQSPDISYNVVASNLFPKSGGCGTQFIKCFGRFQSK